MILTFILLSSISVNIAKNGKSLFLRKYFFIYTFNQPPFIPTTKDGWVFWWIYINNSYFKIIIVL